MSNTKQEQPIINITGGAKLPTNRAEANKTVSLIEAHINRRQPEHEPVKTFQDIFPHEDVAAIEALEDKAIREIGGSKYGIAKNAGQDAVVAAVELTLANENVPNSEVSSSGDFLAQTEISQEIEHVRHDKVA